jgi:hypothetical protein
MGEVIKSGPMSFYEDGHKYINNETEERYKSVTTLISSFEQEFDTEGISASMAKRDGRKQEDIIAEWDLKRDTSNDFGTDVHKFFERMFKSPGHIIIPQNDFEKLILKSYKRTKNLEWDGDVYPEVLVYNHEYKVAGQSDIIHEIPRNNMFDVGDWKTNGNFRYYDPYRKYMKDPLNHLQQCEYNIYGLQLSTYAYFYELMTGMKCRKIFVLYYWREHNIFQVIPMNYMKYEVINMLKKYKELWKS